MTTETPATHFGKEWRQSLKQIASIDRALASKSEWTMRDGYMMAWQLAKHAHPNAISFIEALAQTTRHPDAHRLLAKLLAVASFIRDLPAFQALAEQKQLVAKLYAQDGHVLRVGDQQPESLVIAFCTAYNSFGISNLAMMSAVASLGVSCLIVKDCSGDNYLAGASGLGDNLDETIDALNLIVSRHGFRRVAITGYSSGGFASAYASSRMPCAAYLGLSIPDDFSDSAPPGSEFFLPLKRRMRHSLRYRISLGELFSAEASGPRRRLVAGSCCLRDVRSARRLEGVGGLQVIELKGSDHDTPESLIAAGRFMEQLEWLVGGGEIHP